MAQSQASKPRMKSKKSLETSQARIRSAQENHKLDKSSSENINMKQEERTIENQLTNVNLDIVEEDKYDSRMSAHQPKISLGEFPDQL